MTSTPRSEAEDSLNGMCGYGFCGVFCFLGGGGNLDTTPTDCFVRNSFMTWLGCSS